MLQWKMIFILELLSLISVYFWWKILLAWPLRKNTSHFFEQNMDKEFAIIEAIFFLTSWAVYKSIFLVKWTFFNKKTIANHIFGVMFLKLLISKKTTRSRWDAFLATLIGVLKHSVLGTNWHDSSFYAFWMVGFSFWNFFFSYQVVTSQIMERKNYQDVLHKISFAQDQIQCRIWRMRLLCEFQPLITKILAIL